MSRSLSPLVLWGNGTGNRAHLTVLPQRNLRVAFLCSVKITPVFENSVKIVHKGKIRYA